jgi:hypothetical protein
MFQVGEIGWTIGTTTKGVPVYQVISLDFERIHWF